MRIADDFGLGRGHDRIILSLLEAGRLDGASVMTGGDLAREDLARLQALRAGGAQVGLHLNLTQALPHGGPVWPLRRLMRMALTKRLPDLRLADQLDRFAALFGGLPDYYDGHQHCHCLPGIAAQAASLPRNGRMWMRLPLPTTRAGLGLNLRAGGAKAAVVMACAVHARSVFAGAGWPLNRDFSGFLRLADPAEVARWLPRLLAEAGPDCLVMLHPGAAADPMQCAGHAAASRALEADLLTRA